MSDAKLTVDAITELQNEIATQREVICNLTAMNDELQAKLNKIEQIVKQELSPLSLDEMSNAEIQIREIFEKD